MIKNIFSKILSFILGMAVTVLAGCNTSSGHMDKIPDYPVSLGVSAPFAGFLGDWMWVGGGCNFPEVPAADGGSKKYYDGAYLYKMGHESSVRWISAPSLPAPIAYGASVETAKGLVCLGGMNENGTSTAVYRIERDEAAKNVRINTLPSLSEAIDNASATRVGTTVYVTGGNQQMGHNSLYALTPDTDRIWRKLADYPGPKRIQPVLLGTETALYLLGGFDVETEPKRAVISSNFLIYDLEKNTWSEPHPLPEMADGSPRALVGSAGVYADGKLILAGGVHYDIFRAAVEGKAPKDYLKMPEAWYQFSKDVLVYDVEKATWEVHTGVEGMNKAGGILLYKDGTVYMVCGERKPGIRTPEIVSYQLPVDNSVKD